MELLKSKKFKLPTLYYISDREKVKDIPVGVPFIFGEERNKEYVIRLLEYEILYQKAVSSGLPFNFRMILEDEGYDDMKAFGYDHPVFMDYGTEGGDYDIDTIEVEDITMDIGEESMFKEYVKDSAAYLDVTKLKDLNVFPIWLDAIETAVHTNIHNFAVYNNNMYNKKLGGMYGSLELTSPDRNLIIIDISGSIPKGVSSTCLALAKNLAETFYADLLITGSISTLYQYENLHELDITTIYEVNGMNNDQIHFKKLLTETKRHYRTAIVFGDNDHPGWNWSGAKTISDKEGKKLCQWEIDKLISFHTGGVKHLAGYSRWFSPEETTRIDNWVKYLN